MATPNGEEAISSLKVGDQVEAYDPATHQQSTQTVQKVWINDDTDLLNVTVQALDAPGAQAPVPTQGATQAPASGGKRTTTAPTGATPEETLQTTANHPWLTADQGWVQAGKLKVGEPVVRADGKLGVVVAITVVPGSGIRYDLTVSHIHTFEVGGGLWVVHNCAQPALPEDPPDLPTRYNKGDATTGELRVSGESLGVGSRSVGPAGSGFIAHIPADTPGFASTLRGFDHAESDAAAALRVVGGGDGILFINNTPCSGCMQYLSYRVPYGSSLQIWYIDLPNKITDWTYGGTFLGLPDDTPLDLSFGCGCAPGAGR